MIVLLTTALVLIGMVFLTIGTVGLLRMPDVYNRMHATTKATTMGAAMILLAAAIHIGPGRGLTALVAVLFLFMTAPTGAHLIARAAQNGQQLMDEPEQV